jgi:hypothetical protein
MWEIKQKSRDLKEMILEKGEEVHIQNYSHVISANGIKEYRGIRNYGLFLSLWYCSLSCSLLPL